MTRTQKLRPWLFGLLLAALTIGLLALFAGLAYTGNDDTPILRSTMGYEGGEPSAYNLRMHAAFTGLLYGLAQLWPGAAWFSILQLLLIFISLTMIVKNLCVLAQRHGMPVWAGALAGAAFLAAFTLYSTCRITYTVTASLCGAAAVARLAGTDFGGGGKQISSGIASGAALLLCCYFLRMSAALPSAFFFLLVLALRLRPGTVRQALPALLIAAAVFAAAAGVTLVRNQAQDVKADVHWHTARTALFDYTGLAQEVPAETLAAIGWSRDELLLVEQWYFLDDNITADALKTLTAQQAAAKASQTGGLWPQARDAVAGLFTDAKLRVAVLCVLFMALAAALGGGKHAVLLTALVFLSGAAMLFLLGAMGRLNARAAYSVLLPGAAAIFTAFFSERSSSPRRWKTAVAAAALAACAGFAALAGVWQMGDTYNAPNEYFTDTTTDLHADLDEIALMNEDMLIVYDLSLSHDHRLFPDTAAGIPANLMLWGGWQARSPGFWRTLANFGITELGPAIFLREDVLFASTYDQPPQELLRYIGTAAAGAVDWTYYDQWGYVNLFSFAQ